MEPHRRQNISLLRVRKREVTCGAVKQSNMGRDQKTKKAQVSLRDLLPRKDPKGGTSAPSVPTSLQGFLKRDSVPISRGFSATVVPGR